MLADSTEKIAVLLPCYNEELTIGRTVRQFKQALPSAEIWVFDNNSSDDTVAEARKAGARISYVRQQGKGHVVRSMFQKIDADYYIMADGDATYPAEAAPKLLKPLQEEDADMVVGDRLSGTYGTENKRKFHHFGNLLVCRLIGVLFHQKITDVMSGYRAFNRKFVKSCPILSNGFEIETELTLHALDKRMSLVEVPIIYRDRPAGSFSKLNTYSDGFRVLKTIFRLFKDYRPLLFFTSLGIFLLLGALMSFLPVFCEYLQSGLVPRFPTLICSAFLAVAGLQCITCGFILDSIKRYTDQLFELECIKAAALRETAS